jgi:nucleotidyltransferase substrate binding protein (TIGR01987 family)
MPPTACGKVWLGICANQRTSSQRFEFTYELGHRVLRRVLRDSSATPEDIDRLPFQDLTRTANQQGLLLGDWPAWRRFREMRARTSHAYAADVARLVAESVPAFLAEAEFLRDQLRKRLG